MIKALPYTGQIPGLIEMFPPRRTYDLVAIQVEAEAELAHLAAHGIPDVRVNIVDCMASHAGLMEFDQVWLFAGLLGTNTRAVLAHEVAHWLHRYGKRLGREMEYWAARGGPEEIRNNEVFAEDGRLLFGSEQARNAYRHLHYWQAGDLGVSLPAFTDDGKVAAAKREQLRQIVLSWLPVVEPTPEPSPPTPPPSPLPDPDPPSEAPEPTKPGASVFSDVAQDRWSRPAIEQARERGLMTGYPDGTFKPGQAVTREELATVVVRLDDRLQQILEQKGVK